MDIAYRNKYKIVLATNLIKMLDPSKKEKRKGIIEQFFSEVFFCLSFFLWD